MPLSNANLGLHQVAHGDQLGDRVLNLDARVDLDEVEVALLVHEELDRTGVAIANVAGQRQCVVADLLAFFVVR